MENKLMSCNKRESYWRKWADADKQQNSAMGIKLYVCI